MQRSGANVGPVFQETIEDMDGFPDATGHETAAQSDVGVGDVGVADTTPPAVATMLCTAQLVFVDVPRGPVCRSPLP